MTKTKDLAGRIWILAPLVLAALLLSGPAVAQSGLEAMKDLQSDLEASKDPSGTKPRDNPLDDAKLNELKKTLERSGVDTDAVVVVSLEAGPIWNGNDAKKKCPALAQKNNGAWTEHWWTTVQGKMSVCQIAVPQGSTVALEAGPIWNGNDAKQKCPALAQKTGGAWTGHWWTTVQGKMSVCQIKL